MRVYAAGVGFGVLVPDAALFRAQRHRLDGARRIANHLGKVTSARAPPQTKTKQTKWRRAPRGALVFFILGLSLYLYLHGGWGPWNGERVLELLVRAR